MINRKDFESNATIPLTEVYKKGRKAGIKEVVKWIKKNTKQCGRMRASESAGYRDHLLKDIDWQAQLKIWGIVK